MPKKESSILVNAAKVIGAAAGKIASLASVPPEAQSPTKSAIVSKSPKKQARDLPRGRKMSRKKKASRKG